MVTPTDGILDAINNCFLRILVAVLIIMAIYVIIILAVTKYSKEKRSRGILNWEIEKAVDYYELPIIIAYPGYSKICAPAELRTMWPKALSERIDNKSAYCIHVPLKKEPIFDAIHQFSVVNSKYPKGALGYYTDEAYRNWGIQ